MAPTPTEPTQEERIDALKAQFQDMLRALQDGKPGDRSIADRRWAIVITEVEKAQALFAAWFPGW